MDSALLLPFMLLITNVQLALGSTELALMGTEARRYG
jgi:hypothetical protein